MDSNETKTVYNKLGVPQQLNINNETYTFKKEFNNGIISYRCIHRKCKANLKIATEDARKINSKENNIQSIEFTLNNSHENHPKDNKIQENIKDIKTEKDNLDLAYNLIKNSLDQPLLFHIKNLTSNNIKISRLKIKNILQELREGSYPKDDEFLDNIELIKIDLGISDELKNLNFCPAKINLYNQEKNKIERFAIFTTVFQLKMMAESDELFIDVTFKVAPKKYYQL